MKYSIETERISNMEDSKKKIITKLIEQTIPVDIKATDEIIANRCNIGFMISLLREYEGENDEVSDVKIETFDSAGSCEQNNLWRVTMPIDYECIKDAPNIVYDKKRHWSGSTLETTYQTKVFVSEFEELTDALWECVIRIL